MHDASPPPRFRAAPYKVYKIFLFQVKGIFGIGGHFEMTTFFTKLVPKFDRIIVGIVEFCHASGLP